ncbi:MAG: ABC transporter ATP-binding protein [Chloroflexi bacterium HGW-Chloroflexi-3]|nr:MAG: ABC transporter ATP-binding protein [Chloroflexi bacterium HGW-Chloroflexi-3]
MQKVTKIFGELVANDHVDFQLRKGEIHALLGENGAGKTTLMRILYGLYQQTTGDIFIDGEKVTINSPKDAIKKGVGMVTQHFALVPPMTVAENVVLGYTDSFVLDQAAIEKKVGEAANQFSLDINPKSIVRHLSVGQRQRVEILKALYRNAKVLILDEPTAVLVPQEVDSLFETLDRLRKDGLSVIFISHKLDEVTKITDRVTVLRDGKSIGTVDTVNVTQKQLAAMMVGRDTFGVTRQTEINPDNKKILEVEDLCALDDKGLPALKNLKLSIRSGEILGIAGVGGNGQKELAEILSGVKAPISGVIKINDKNLVGKDPSEFSKMGIGRIPEDRHEGVVGDLTVYENLALEHLDEYSKNGFLDKQAIRKNANELIKNFQIKAKPTDRIRTLSGGNMQKVLLARVLSRQPEVVIAPQPTRGLDVGATEYVRQQLLEQRTRGAAVMLISEDLDEILSISDRIAVIYEGEIVGTINAQNATPEKLGLMMSGALREKA